MYLTYSKVDDIYALRSFVTFATTAHTAWYCIVIMQHMCQQHLVLFQLTQPLQRHAYSDKAHACMPAGVVHSSKPYCAHHKPACDKSLYCASAGLSSAC